jgi:hypothetical protein
MSRSLTATVLMALMALSPGIPALAQQDWKRSERDILLCRGEPFEPGSLAGYEACFSARLHPDEQSWPPPLPLIGLYFIPHADYSFCFVGAGKPGSLEAILVGRSGELIFGLDRPLAPSELGGENPWIIQRKLDYPAKSPHSRGRGIQTSHFQYQPTGGLRRNRVELGGVRACDCASRIPHFAGRVFRGSRVPSHFELRTPPLVTGVRSWVLAGLRDGSRAQSKR